MILHEDECEDRKLAEQLKISLEEDAYSVIMSSDVPVGRGKNNDKTKWRDQFRSDKSLLNWY